MKTEVKTNGVLSELFWMLKTRIRDYAMYIALAAIFIIFGFTTGGAFLSPRNLTNLINQTGYIAVMAVAMTLILIICEIDLSVGYVSGFLGAVCAIMMCRMGISMWIVIPIILILGVLIGVAKGLIVTKMGVPAFVTTLAFEFAFRGLLSLATSESGTIPIPIDTFNAISNGFVPDIGQIAGMHALSLIVGALVIVLMLISRIKNRKKLQKYRSEERRVGKECRSRWSPYH